MTCTCAEVRRAARALSSVYDSFLAPAGLTVTQYSMLAKIARAKRLSRTELAGILGMDRTTLTRNLRPLEKEKLVAERTGEDRREQLVYLTAAGRKKLKRGLPLWQKAQEGFAKVFGADRASDLRELLHAATEAATTLRGNQVAVHE